MIRRGHNLIGGILLRKVAMALVGGILFIGTSQAGLPPQISQIVAVDEQLVDEFGAVLKGTDPAAAYFGLTPVEGDLVHIYYATERASFPPATNGVADTRDILLKESRVGVGSSPNLQESGKFSALISPRPSGGVTLYVRVFNAPTLEEASFYMDSQIFTVSSVENESFIADFASGIVPLDSNDNDSDGINNSWEKSYGSNAAKEDSDGDGLNDEDEIIAGTDLVNAESTFAIANMTLMPPDEIKLSWKSEIGRSYTIECKEDISGEEPYIVIDELEGDGSVFERVVPAAANVTALYRILVETTGEPD